MKIQDFKRKLTAVLSADVKGYSRLMQDDVSLKVPERASLPRSWPPRRS